MNRFLRDAYCKYSQPKNKIKSLSFMGYSAEFKVDNPLELRIVEAILEKGFGEYQILEKLFESLKQNDVVYDIGASIGTHAVFMAKKVGESGKLITFEPEAESFEKLKANIDLNSINNVICLNKALGDNLGKGMLYSYGGGYGAFNLRGFGNDKYEVEIVPGDLLVKEKGLPLPRVVKIDVEGSEYNVIRGLEKTLREDECRMVCCEIHPGMLPDDIKPEMITELLKSYGFNHIETYPRSETFHAFCYKNRSN